MLRYFLFLLISFSALSCEAFTSPKDTLQGKVVGIADGDTFTFFWTTKPQQDRALLYAILTSECDYLRGLVNEMIGREIQTIGITGIENFDPELVSVRGHKFYLVSSKIPKYQIHIHFEGDYNAGFFEFGNYKYAVFGNFDLVDMQWQLSNISPMNMD